MRLEDIVEIIIPKRYKNTVVGEEVLRVSQNDFSKSGFTTECGELSTVDDKNYLKYALKPYDILLGKNGSPFKVAIIGKINQDLLAKESLYILRFKNDDNIEENTIRLYMYLKSNKAQEELNNLSKGSNIKQICKADLSTLNIPNLKENSSQIVENFYNEQRIYKDIYESHISLNKLHTYFDDKQELSAFGICKMCSKLPATHLRIDTWQPLKKGIPMCDKCSQNIMF